MEEEPVDETDLMAGQLRELSESLRLERVRVEQLMEAMRTRDVIGQAKGILMEWHRIDEDRALAILIEASCNSNRKLRDVAERLARTGAL